VYKFGPPYQSSNGINGRVQGVRTFLPITILRHESTSSSKIRRNLVNIPSGVDHERKVTNHEKLKIASATTSARDKVTTNHVSAKTTKAAIKSLSHGSSFIFACSYSDSVGLLPKLLLQLGQFAKDLGIQEVVAPWVFGYRVYGLKRFVPNVDKGQNSLALNRLYDLKSVNNLMTQCSGTMVTSFTNFIEKASRNITIIYLVRNNLIEPHQFHLSKENEKILTEQFKKAQIVDCLSLVKNSYLQTTAGKDLIDALNSEVDGSSQTFQVTSFICVDNNKVVKMERINNFIRRKGNHTVILLNWRGYASLVKKPYDSSKYWVETMHNFPGDKCHKTIMPFHYEVPRAAHHFLSHSGITGTSYLSVYISFEYLARLNNREYAECCLKETNRVIGAMITRYHVSHVVIIGDHSNQSSSICDDECVKRSVAMINTMTSWGLNVTRFNPNIMGAKHHHPAFNIFTEISLLSTGNRLIIVGQNVWFSQIKTSFMQHYPLDGTAKLYAICTSTGTYLRDLASKTIQCKDKK